MVVSDRAGVVAILIPKTGTRTILHYMEQYHEGRLEGNHTYGIPYKYENYFKFCVVRNPYSRIVSHWYGGSQRGEQSKRYKFKEVLGDIHFRTYLQYLVADKTDYKKEHRLIWPFEIKQIDYLLINNYNRILEFENLDGELRSLPFIKESDNIGFRNATIKEDDNNPISRKHWSEYIDGKNLKLINQYFQEDFEYINNEIYKEEKYPMYKTVKEMKKDVQERGI